MDDGHLAGGTGGAAVQAPGAGTCPLGAAMPGATWPPRGFRHLFPAMSPPAPPAPADMTTRQRLAALAGAMQSVDPGDPADDNPRIPAGYTYLLQFVAHDLVRSAAQLWAIPGRAREMRDLAVTRLRLDTLYGGGPAACPYAYMTAARARLRIEAIAPHALDGAAAPPLRDIPRTRLDPAPRGWPAEKSLPLDEALLPDPRNDDNSNVSQMTVLFAAFHNAVVDLLGRAMAAPLLRFAVAREAVTLVYRRILREDLLKRLLHEEVHARYAAPGAAFLEAGGDGLGRMPLEFCLGAFRCGHAMVRETYRINAASVRDLGGILRATSGGSAGAMPLSRHWVIRWSDFFAMPGSAMPEPNASRRLRPRHSPGLLDTEFFDAVDDTRRAGLAYRDLLGAGVAALHPVDALWDYLRRERPDLVRLSPLSDATARRAALEAWLARAGVPAEHRGALAAAPPLPFYVLFEAEHDCAGLSLGALGSVIVAETMLGVLARDPLPSEAGDGVAQALARLCNAAGVPAGVLAPLAEVADMAGLVGIAAAAPGIGARNPPFV